MQEIIEQALRSGYLTIEAENKLRQLLRNKCQPEDIRAFMKLQRETMEGNVKQEARELLYNSYGEVQGCQGSIAIAC